MLVIKNLHAKIEDKPVLRGLTLEVKAGEVHAIMGPNGSGKSTLVKIIAGHPSFEVTEGEIIYNGVNLLELEPEERAQSGIFMAFQYPVEIPGVTNMSFLRQSLNSVRRANELEELDPLEFDDYVREKMALVEMDDELLNRNVNVGFSGGEKKRNEILQMAVLQPKLSLLDETDSGLDIDALRIVAKGINELSSANNAVLLVTHYQRLLNYVVPDKVHVLVDGRIVKSGGKELALELEENGYDGIEQTNLHVNGTA